jgi:hypothetical protein
VSEVPTPLTPEQQRQRDMGKRWADNAAAWIKKAGEKIGEWGTAAGKGVGKGANWVGDTADDGFKKVTGFFDAFGSDIDKHGWSKAIGNAFQNMKGANVFGFLLGAVGLYFVTSVATGGGLLGTIFGAMAAFMGGIIGVKLLGEPIDNMVASVTGSNPRPPQVVQAVQLQQQPRYLRQASAEVGDVTAFYNEAQAVQALQRANLSGQRFPTGSAVAGTGVVPPVPPVYVDRGYEGRG